jgi:two-component system, chemotaxis family, response regulator Rcp1
MQNNGEQKIFDILLIEDNPGDIRLIEEAFKEGNSFNNIIVMTDGSMALSFLHDNISRPTNRHPALILLDLNMPGKDGREVLAEIKSDPLLKHIPVVVLTSSAAEQDIIHAYSLQANACITKPHDLNDLFSVLKSIEAFWLKSLI